jgi:hypothetical protein
MVFFEISNFPQYHYSMDVFISFFCLIPPVSDILGDMWKASAPTKYLGFRTFIMGITGNDSLFPKGVTYEGCDENPRFYRGETGAQDSIIPSSDTFLGVSLTYHLILAHLIRYKFDWESCILELSEPNDWPLQS